MSEETRLSEMEGFRLRQYGGAKVNRRFTMGGEVIERGAELTADQVHAIPRANLNSLINGGFLHPYPPADVPPPRENVERFLVRRSDLKYDVVEGVRVNAEPLAKAEAEALL